MTDTELVPVHDRLAGRVAVVTGAASGIGAATARRLAAEGAAVVAVDLAADEVERVAADIRAEGGASTAVVGDVSQPDAWDAIVRGAEREFGGLDVLHSNAFATILAPAHELAPADWDRQLAVNLKAAYLGVRAGFHLLRRRGGSVIFTSSTHAVAGLPEHPAYAAAKGGLVSLGQQLAVEYGPEIRVNTILPGPIWVPRWADVPAADQRRSVEQTALKRFGTAEEVAAVVAFLASPDSAYITGASLLVDGGWNVVRNSA